MQDVDVAISVGADQGAIAGAGVPVPAAAVNDSPTGAEHVEEREEEIRAMSSSSEGDEGCQDQASAPTCPIPAAHPALQARDVVLAVRNLTFLAKAQVLVPTLMQRFTTDVSPSELATRMEWL